MVELKGTERGQISKIIISLPITRKQKYGKIEQRKKCMRLSKAFKWTALYFVL